MCHKSPLLDWGLRDYGTARWDGGDPECDHIERIKGNTRGGLAAAANAIDGHNRKQEARSDNDNSFHGEQFRSFCGKCGARRIDHQLGLEPTPDEFIRTMAEVFREVWRVLRDDGTLWLNIGDSYAGGKTGRDDAGRNSDTFSPRGGNRLGSGNCGNGKQRAVPSGFKPKDLVGIPWRLAFALQADGWYLRSDIIWAKPNPMPESVTDRPTKSHEYMFLLSKQERYYFDADAIAEPSTDRESLEGRRPRKNHVLAQIDPNGEGRTRVGFLEGHANQAGVTYPTRNARTVWSIPTESYVGAHFATFPRKLVEPCIKAGTSEKGCCPVCGAGWVRDVELGDIVPSGHNGTPRKGIVGNSNNFQSQGFIGRYERSTTGWRPGCSHDAAPVPAVVLDPFVGSGTSIVVANALGRRGIGLDLSREYLGLAQRRIARPHAKIPRPEREGNSRDLPGQLRMF